MNAFGLTADTDLEAALRSFASEVVERKATEFLFHQGEKPHGCYLIKKGVLRLSIQAHEGDPIIQKVIGKGSVVGLPATINGGAYSLSCEILEDAELAHLSRQDLTLLLRSDTAMAIKILDLLSSEVHAVRSELAKLPRTQS
ncbi:MAG TPA: Crp/Fnr family transcriptional regulator [Terriglobales bacterium]|nr:Crp/Fnr family transcriptional regulator [Terriglobales bacterium]